MASKKISFLLSLLTVLFGCSLISYATAEKITWVTKSPQASIQTAEEQSKKPIKIYVPALKRSLDITDGYITRDRWAISETGVSFLTTSTLPGRAGNTVIYGHNTQDKLGGLWRVHAGDNIYVVLAGGELVKYQVTDTKEIQPTQVEILNQTDDKRLTLYTCSGFLDQARFVVIAQAVDKTS